MGKTARIVLFFCQDVLACSETFSESQICAKFKARSHFDMGPGPACEALGS